MILYDNLKDAQDKLLKTIVMYDGKAGVVIDVNPADAQGKLPYLITLKVFGGGVVQTNLADEKFNFREYNLGYANHGSQTYWWYRKPLKQFKQGLTSQQVGHLFSMPDVYGGVRFELSKGIANMFENVYPHISVCEKSLKDGESLNQSFHRDFALAYDKFHRDCLLEYKGKMIGQSHNMKDFHLIKEFSYLHEAVKEAVG